MRKKSPKQKFKVGDYILVIGFVDSPKICTGLYGFIDSIGQKKGEPTTYLVQLLTKLDPDPELTQYDYRDTWTERVQATDIVPLTDPEKLKAAETFKYLTQRPPRGPRDPMLQKIMEQTMNPTKEELKKREKVAASVQIQEKEHPLPGHTKRGNKSKFPAYGDSISSERWYKVIHFAEKGPKNCTIEELALWKVLRENLEKCSFWSNHQECRDLVKELDLDPFKSSHEIALYQDKTNVYAPVGTLRVKAIELWNQNLEILQIQNMGDESNYQGAHPKGEIKGFSITYAKRRQLPIPS